MTGYQSKKKSRHADEITLDHLIKLRKKNEELREALQNIASKNPFHNQCPPAGDTNYYGKLIAEMVVIANAALKEKE